MKWLKTFSLVIRSNVSALCEHFENPERMLQQLLIDMEEAYARLEDRDPKAEELAQQFAEREQKERLQKEFEELKRRVEPDK